MTPIPSLYAVLTNATCGAACWEAREEICRCSCGGKNHGIMRHGGEQPQRTCRIDGRWYTLAAIGTWSEIRHAAHKYNWPDGYNGPCRTHDAALDKPATASQRKWPEVKAAGHAHPSLLWVPMTPPTAQPETNTELRQLDAEPEFIPFEKWNRVLPEYAHLYTAKEKAAIRANGGHVPDAPDAPEPAAGAQLSMF